MPLTAHVEFAIGAPALGQDYRIWLAEANTAADKCRQLRAGWQFVALRDPIAHQSHICINPGSKAGTGFGFMSNAISAYDRSARTKGEINREGHRGLAGTRAPVFA